MRRAAEQVPKGDTAFRAGTHWGRCWQVASGLLGRRQPFRLGLQEALIEQAVVLFDAWQGEAGGA